MADRTKVVPGSVDTDDNFVALFVPADGIADTTGPTVTELTATTVKDITYSLTTDGWTPGADQASGTDDRLTLSQTFETPGKVTHSLQVKYVFGADDDVANVALVQDTEGYVVARYAVPYTQEFDAADVVDVFPVTAGVAPKDTPAANGKFTRGQKLFVTGEVQQDVAVATA